MTAWSAASPAQAQRVDVKELLYHNEKFYQPPQVRPGPGPEPCLHHDALSYRPPPRQFHRLSAKSRLKARTVLVMPRPKDEAAAAVGAEAVRVPEHKHELIRSASATYECDLCGREGTAFACPHDECDFDICQSCYERRVPCALARCKHAHPLVRAWHKDFKCDACLDGCLAPEPNVLGTA